MKKQINHYKNLLNGKTLEKTKKRFNVDKLSKAVDFHQNDYIKRVSQVREGGPFNPSGDYAKKYIKGGFDGLMAASKRLNGAEKKIQSVKNLQTATRVGTAGAVLGAGAYGLSKIKKKKEEIEKKAMEAFQI